MPHHGFTISGVSAKLVFHQRGRQAAGAHSGVYERWCAGWSFVFDYRHVFIDICVFIYCLLQKFDEQSVWLCKIHTSDVIFAGTDAKVSMVVYGAAGQHSKDLVLQVFYFSYFNDF